MSFSELKRKFYKWRTFRSLTGVNSKDVFVNGRTILNKKTVLGTNVHFNGLQVVGNGEVEIGDNFHSGSGCLLIPEIHNYEGESLPYDDTYIRKKIIIEDNVWLGANVIILAGVTVGEGAIIQAGAVVTKNIDKCCIAGGNPAEVFKKREQNHYDKLKEEGKFH